MQLLSQSITDGERIPEDFAFGKHHPEDHVELCANRNPDFSWQDLPEGTRTLILICHDVDVPTVPDDVNQEGRTVPYDLPRADFYHWVLLDIAPGDSIAAGEFSSSVTPRGKSGPDSLRGTLQGLNDYTGWFSGDADMAGQYFGYDGPCPPWNDERLHHYHFTLYATDLANCPVEGAISGPAVLEAIEGHVLASAKIVSTYSIYPDARA